MLKFFQLTKRNASLYFRDKMAVFSSMLSMIIIIGLMLIFLGDMYIDGLNEIFESIPDAGNKTKDAKLLVLSWTTAGIIPHKCCYGNTFNSYFNDKRQNLRKNKFNLYCSYQAHYYFCFIYCISMDIVGNRLHSDSCNF